jgi:predicted Abi (CAAX) family protease
LQHLRQPPRSTFNADYESDTSDSAPNYDIKRNDSVNSLDYYPFPTTLDR